jgi:selenocysteine lyase/cysteine desulfurase
MVRLNKFYLAFVNASKKMQTKKMKVVVLSHIPYCGGKLPVDKIIKYMRDLVRNREIFFIVDGAHAYGQEKIDVEKINCDFYASGSHKFGLAPKLGFLGTKIEYINELTTENYRLPVFNSFAVCKELRQFLVKKRLNTRERELATIDGSCIVGYNAAYKHLFDRYGILQVNKKIAHLTEYLCEKAKENFRVLSLEQELRSGIISIQIPIEEHMPISRIWWRYWRLSTR